MCKGTKVRYYHYRLIKSGTYGCGEPRAKGGVTVAVICDHDYGLCSMGASRCSLNDMFCKATGRDTAYDRAVDTMPCYNIMPTKEEINQRAQACFYSTYCEDPAHYDGYYLDSFVSGRRYKKKRK